MARANKVHLTVFRLVQLTKQRFPTRFTSVRGGPAPSMPRTPRLTYTPFVGVGILSIRVQVQGVSEKKLYKIIVTIQGVKFSPVKTKNHTVKIKLDNQGGKPRFVWMRPLTTRNKMQIRCGCLDFYFTFAWWAWEQRALYGRKPRKYTRKTPPPPKGYPFRNPFKTPGLCKHLLAAYTKLRRSRHWKR